MSGALVRVMRERPEAIPDEVYCQPCVDVSGSYAVSGPDGSFQIDAVYPGQYWLVVEKGQFRIERQITVGEGEILEVPAEYTTLPSRHAPAAGQWVPRIAVALGSYDAIEDVLAKMGLGDLDGEYHFTPNEASDRIDFYLNGRFSVDYPTRGDFAQLVRDLDRMKRYHIIFVPCTNSINSDVLRDPQVLRNIRDYVKAGGKWYVTDWAGEWHDNVFPAFVELHGSSEDTPAEAFDPGDLSDPSDDTWNPSLFGDADGSEYDSDDAEAVDENLAAWLAVQQAPWPDGAGVMRIDPMSFPAVDNWNIIRNVHPVTIGYDSERMPVVERPKVWVIGDNPEYTEKKPLTVTYEPIGCGRVLYTTYHTTVFPGEMGYPGLTPQERILLYLIMEIGVCKSGPIVR